MSIYISLAVCLVGLVMMIVYGPPATPGHATKNRVGEICFLCGLLSFLLMFHGTLGFLK
jgi:hypothetical protein